MFKALNKPQEVTKTTEVGIHPEAPKCMLGIHKILSGIKSLIMCKRDEIKLGKLGRYRLPRTFICKLIEKPLNGHVCVSFGFSNQVLTQEHQFSECHI